MRRKPTDVIVCFRIVQLFLTKLRFSCSVKSCSLAHLLGNASFILSRIYMYIKTERVSTKFQFKIPHFSMENAFEFCPV